MTFEHVKDFEVSVVAGVLVASREIDALDLETDSVEGINPQGTMHSIIPSRRA